MKTFSRVTFSLYFFNYVNVAGNPSLLFISFRCATWKPTRKCLNLREFRLAPHSMVILKRIQIIGDEMLQATQTMKRTPFNGTKTSSMLFIAWEPLAKKYFFLYVPSKPLTIEEEITKPSIQSFGPKEKFIALMMLTCWFYFVACLTHRHLGWFISIYLNKSEFFVWEFSLLRKNRESERNSKIYEIRLRRRHFLSEAIDELGMEKQ